MMKSRIPLAMLVWATACSAPTPPPRTDPAPELPAVADPLALHRGLLGDWVDRSSPRFTCFEHWSAQGDSMLNGFGYVLAKNDTVFVENLRIEAINGAVVYSARINSQNGGQWVPFTALPGGPDSLVYENPGHDFPQCITYVRDSTGGWEVTTTGNENGTERLERFHFVRL
ncbi:MAG: hypothetical protein JST41_08560 [Bacteroidetes bacterium]|jgi:hypothetical protein|nr:hypothetical protein [Bacteroidota bacterium]MBX7127687.1 hypothetical protein [Flavobacteriales bacterium]MCC6655160.1 hypothetical protein [Flavobacteriales bacterium]HMU14675.1 DUF6265 family protein [Flavobacteriales bacterium]HMZ47923.1 DUF6265 family protein [Flavobacteriales bacterium]